MRLALIIISSSAILGCAYALLGLSFTVAFNASKVFNFAVGQFAVLGGLFLISLPGRNVVLRVVVALIGTALVGIITYVIALRRPDTRGADPLTLVIITLGISVVITNGSIPVWGGNALSAPALLSGSTNIDGVEIPDQGLLLVVVTIAVAVALWLFLSHSLPGKAFRAIGDDREAARMYGVPESRILTIGWALAGLLAGIAGALYLPLSSVSMPAALTLGVDGFAAATIGGTGSPLGAVVAGFLLAVIDTLVGVFVTSSYVNTVTFGMLIVFLLIRPAGLFGRSSDVMAARA